MPVEPLAKMRTPCHVESAIRWTKWRHRHSGLPQPGNPAAIGAKSGPASAAQCEHGGIGMDRFITIQRIEFQINPGVVAAIPGGWSQGKKTCPFVARVKGHAGITESLEPCSQ